MNDIDIPFLGNLVLCATLVLAAYTFVVAIAGARGRPRMLVSARYGAYATCALVAVTVCLLAYAFQTHDFRLRYVARYSDRSMSAGYLVAALWGGQDGSLLWWSLLLSGYTAACVRWIRGRYVELQPWVIATLMSILAFFVLMMLFAANPFATYISSAPPEGEGLNPLLQNYWMTIHPPSLYLGFVGWSVPFAFVVAALATGRLNDEWIVAARKWSLVAWLFLSIGLLLGMLWSYEELGWGGYWAWDPVENASFMPWLAGTAYLHSVMVQERYGMLKLWNVFLMCLTFFMTIFGTFLTRSGLIASVHSFARSDIGVWFIWYLAFLAVGCVGMCVWRWSKFRADHRIDSLMSREFAFLLNNWILLGMMLFVLVATTFPLLSEWLRGQEVTVGPPFYNKWMVPLGLVLLALLGIGPLISWRKATGKNLVRAFTKPVGFAVVVGIVHTTMGNAIGFPARVASEEIYETVTGQVLAAIYSVAPVASTVFSAFVLATIAQEFWRGTRVRMRTKDERFTTAFVSLVGRARRRYGGYIVHVGMVLLYLGFTGAAYDSEKETTLRPGQALSIGGYHLRYERPRMEADPNKRMIFTDLTLLDSDGERLGALSPAKFIYRTHPEMPTTEVAIRSNLLHDLYVIMSTVDPQSKRATFRVVQRPLVAWIWLGGLILILGTLIAMAPSIKELLPTTEDETSGPYRGLRTRPAVAAAIVLMSVAGAAGLVTSNASAQSDSSSSLHAGTVVVHDPEERKLFERVLCQCGDCARLPLDTCACGWAEDKRAELRAQLHAGESVPAIVAQYRAKYGPKAISVPGDEGLDRALWAVPVALIAVAAVGVVFMARRWRKRGRGASAAPKESVTPAPSAKDDARYDEMLDDELRRLGGG